MLLRLSVRANLVIPPKLVNRVTRSSSYRDRTPAQLLPETKRHSNPILRWQDRNCIMGEKTRKNLLIAVTMFSVDKQRNL